MRSKRLALNTTASLLLQVSSLISGFIVPRLILLYFGSQVNGLVNSIAQFLSVISFLELGVSAVVQSALYKPLVDKDKTQISKIVSSANKFFNRVGLILLIYVIALIAVYPSIVSDAFDWCYTAILIIAMGINSFCQFYFGIVDYQLLTADQKGYIQYFTQTVTVLGSTLVAALIIYLGGSIQLVKLSSSLIFLIRPIVLRIYVNKNYDIDRKITYTDEPIKQKWNGVAQHISAVVIDQTDIIVLTVFSTLSNVSIYSVYHLVIYGVKTLFTALTNGLQALLGEVWAYGDKKEVERYFSTIEWVLHTGVVYIFGCTGILIIPFITVYTSGITDANYIQPLFSCLIVLAHAMHCIRLPYHLLIKAGGMYRETQTSYIVAAIVNVSITVLAVFNWGLVGAATGTLVSMIIQTIWMVIFCYRNMLKRSVKYITKQFIADILSVIICVSITIHIKLSSISYLSWTVLAIEVSLIWLVVCFIINLVFYKKTILSVLRFFKHRNNE